jgi:hypothetical protein
MIARPKISRNEWEKRPRSEPLKLGISHPFAAQVNATCIPFGQTVTLVQGEEAKCCEMGDKGLAACCCLCPVVYCFGVPPAAPINFSCAAAALVTAQRERLKAAYEIKDDKPAFGGFLCYCCALWHQHVFLQEMALAGAKGLDTPLAPAGEDA